MQILKSTTLCALTVSGFLLVLVTTCSAQESPPVATEGNRGVADTRNNEGERSKLSQRVADGPNHRSRI